ncbi:hypothetical protein [Rhodopirellula sp. MGV]|uniref:hypothetical protein n=1 Tax=Rhodopirellula sp. MGV TaxID=2023130 RepID=UPI000B971CB3|nr:hypothetical protein [Rhodopirellula sp. MGV]OYP31684.1 hypothetical protein CGZ80_20520 [Rhodopirellula sp. MGV]PNY33985.1 hypothetical protein C2E31_25465 [Rhodopirellula baltica]
MNESNSQFRSVDPMTDTSGRSPLASEPMPRESKGQTRESSASTGNQTGNPDLSPLEGGRWRPVTPDELLRRPSTTEDFGSEASQEQKQKVQLERRQELEHKLKANPTDLDGFLELAAIYRDEQRPIEAKRLLQQAKQIFPDDEQVTWQLEEAILARSLQQLREVTDLADRINSVEADRELERSRSDWAHRRMDVCRARLERDPSQVSYRLVMAEAKFDAELFEESYKDAGRLTELDEYSPAAHFLRAKCLLAMGKDLPAMKELRAVALRRAVVAPKPLRRTSLMLLIELSEKLALSLTGQHYRKQLQQLDHAIAAEKQAAASQKESS